jgi:hypothetical protein
LLNVSPAVNEELVKAAVGSTAVASINWCVNGASIIIN